MSDWLLAGIVVTMLAGALAWEAWEARRDPFPFWEREMQDFMAHDGAWR